MTVKELIEVTKLSEVELHDSKDGRLVASSHKSIEKYSEVRVISAYPQIRVTSSSCDFARAYLYIFIDHQGVERIRNKE